MIPENTDWMKGQMNHQPTKEYADNIYALVSRFKPYNVLEIGCMWGISTLAILSANKGCKLLSVDKSSYTHAEEEVTKAGWRDRWRWLNMNSKDYWRQTDEQFDLIYIDGDHSYDFAIIDLKGAWEHTDSGVIALDDAAHKNNRPNDVDNYGVSIAFMEHWRDHPKLECGWEGRILWLRK